MTRVRSLGVLLLACAVLAACGNGIAGNGAAIGSSSARVINESNNSSLPAQSGSDATSGTPAPVSVAAGQEVTGVNITVTPPGSSAPPSAEDLGVNPVRGLGMAANTGGSIRRGSTMRILLFGPGLHSRMRITVAGPPDITISKLQGITATDNTPGIAFLASVSPSAELGARTLYLKNENGDETAFAGGLEVVP